jgi:sporulation protein YlmC with PRC-barrel domain
MVTSQVRPLLNAVLILVGLSLGAAAQQAPPVEQPAISGQPVPAAPSDAPNQQPDAQAAPQAPKTPAVKPSDAPVTPSLVGLVVFSSDGTRVGEVRSVDTGPNGTIVGLQVRTGGFLGFGGRIVAIPEGKFIRSGQSIRIDLDSDEVTGLPDVKD